MDRRGFLRIAGLASLAGALGACARDGGHGSRSGKAEFAPVAAVAPEPTGPFAAAFHDVAVPLGAYVADVDIPPVGVTGFVAVTGDGPAGSDEVQAATPATSRLAAPGDAVAVATPTWADDRGVARVCTADPPCGMHETSLDQALAQNRPVVVIFTTATPPRW